MTSKSTSGAAPKSWRANGSRLSTSLYVGVMTSERERRIGFNQLRTRSRFRALARHRHGLYREHGGYEHRDRELGAVFLVEPLEDAVQDVRPHELLLLLGKELAEEVDVEVREV